jgi:hypothetical protein
MDTEKPEHKYLKEYKEQLIKIWCILTSFSFGGNNYYRSNQFSRGSQPLNSLRWLKNESMQDVDTDEVKKSFCKTFFEKVVLQCALPTNTNTNTNDEFIKSIDWNIFSEAKLIITESMGNKTKEKEYDLKKDKDIKIYDSQCRIVLTLPLDKNYISQI